MRVLMVTVELPTPERPGTLAPLARQIDSLRAAGLHVDVLEIKGMPKLKYAVALRRLWALAPQADLIHAHYGFCGWLARLQRRRPVVVSFMGSDLLGSPDPTGRISRLSQLEVQANRWLARLADAVIVKSAEMAELVAPVPAHVIPNGVDPRLFRPIPPAEARAALDWPPGRRYVLFPGSPANPRKNFPLAKAAVEHAATRLGEPIELVPLGGVAPDRVGLYMNACDVMTMTSYLEGSPNVVKEAMACDLPVVAVVVGDVPELLAGVKHCAICPRDPAALGVALEQVLRDGQRTNGRLALQRLRLDLDSVARQVIRIYEDVLAGQHAPAPRVLPTRTDGTD
jgi:glycosyltransferase involved in cell wall biosynthesis